MYTWIIVLVIIALGVILYAGKMETSPHEGKSFQNLDRRFANGEIYKEEYEEQTRIINS